MRHGATRNLLEERDTIIVASVSCIYGLGSVESYSSMAVKLELENEIEIKQIAKKLSELQYERNEISFTRGTFRIIGDILEIFPSHYEDRAWRISFFGDEIEKITEFDPLTGKNTSHLESITIYPNSHYTTPRPTINQAIENIKIELKERLEYFNQTGKLLEAQRLEQRTRFDLEMLTTTGHCKSIENYSRYLTGRKAGEAPPTLFEYLPSDTIIFIDESHITVPQLHGMYNGDRARKKNLSDFGFRLPSCMDNRPLKFEEWNSLRPQTIYVSATPSDWELNQTQGEFAEQVIRPTGLLDPICEIKPVENQIDDLMHECKKIIAKNERVLVTTLTKKMSEHLTDYLNENGIKVRYLHSDIDTLERIEIIRDLRMGVFDVLVGINLLREGLDIPECSLVAILDADKEGFLRSTRSLIQTIGRAARNSEGKVILYADKITDSIKQALNETKRRRKKQQAYNIKNNITPKTISKQISDITKEICDKDYAAPTTLAEDNISKTKDISKQIKKLTKDMRKAAENLEFEKAAKIRDDILKLEKMELDLT